MADSKDLLHVRLDIEENGAQLTYFFSIAARNLREMELTEDRMSAHRLFNWLVDHGGELDRDDGPAMIQQMPSGSNVQYWRNGKLHRDDGPAVTNDTGGWKREMYYREGELHRDQDEGPAVIDRVAPSLTIVQYWHNGARLRGGIASISETRLRPLGL
jgi:hypothetical protein